MTTLETKLYETATAAGRKGITEAQGLTGARARGLTPTIQEVGRAMRGLVTQLILKVIYRGGEKRYKV